MSATVQANDALTRSQETVSLASASPMPESCDAIVVEAADESRGTQFHDLPRPVVHMILQQVGASDLCNCFLVCRTWRAYGVHDSPLWTHLWNVHFKLHLRPQVIDRDAFMKKKLRLELPYFRAISSLPKPTREQCRAFAKWFAHNHNWYRLLPIQGTARIALFASPTVQQRRKVGPDDQVTFLDVTALRGPAGSGNRLSTQQYRDRFGHLHFRVMAEMWEAMLRGTPDVRVYDVDGTELRAPMSAIPVVHVTALIDGEKGMYMLDRYFQEYVANENNNSRRNFALEPMDVPSPRDGILREPFMPEILHLFRLVHEFNEQMSVLFKALTLAPMVERQRVPGRGGGGGGAGGGGGGGGGPEADDVKVRRKKGSLLQRRRHRKLQKRRDLEGVRMQERRRILQQALTNHLHSPSSGSDALPGVLSDNDDSDVDDYEDDVVADGSNLYATCPAGQLFPMGTRMRKGKRDVDEDDGAAAASIASVSSADGASSNTPTATTIYHSLESAPVSERAESIRKGSRRSRTFSSSPDMTRKRKDSASGEDGSGSSSSAPKRWGHTKKSSWFGRLVGSSSDDSPANSGAEMGDSLHNAWKSLPRHVSKDADAEEEPQVSPPPQLRQSQRPRSPASSASSGDAPMTAPLDKAHTVGRSFKLKSPSRKRWGWSLRRSKLSPTSSPAPAELIEVSASTLKPRRPASVRLRKSESRPTASSLWRVDDAPSIDEASPRPASDSQLSSSADNDDMADEDGSHGRNGKLHASLGNLSLMSGKKVDQLRAGEPPQFSAHAPDAMVISRKSSPGAIGDNADVATSGSGEGSGVAVEPSVGVGAAAAAAAAPAGGVEGSGNGWGQHGDADEEELSLLLQLMEERRILNQRILKLKASLAAKGKLPEFIMNSRDGSGQRGTVPGPRLNTGSKRSSRKHRRNNKRRGSRSKSAPKGGASGGGSARLPSRSPLPQPSPLPRRAKDEPPDLSSLPDFHANRDTDGLSLVRRRLSIISEAAAIRKKTGSGRTNTVVERRSALEREVSAQLQHALQGRPRPLSAVNVSGLSSFSVPSSPDMRRAARAVQSAGGSGSGSPSYRRSWGPTTLENLTRLEREIPVPEDMSPQTSPRGGESPAGGLDVEALPYDAYFDDVGLADGQDVSAQIEELGRAPLLGAKMALVRDSFALHSALVMYCAETNCLDVLRAWEFIDATERAQGQVSAEERRQNVTRFYDLYLATDAPRALPVGSAYKRRVADALLTQVDLPPNVLCNVKQELGQPVLQVIQQFQRQYSLRRSRGEAMTLYSSRSTLPALASPMAVVRSSSRRMGDVLERNVGKLGPLSAASRSVLHQVSQMTVQETRTYIEHRRKDLLRNLFPRSSASEVQELLERVYGDIFPLYDEYGRHQAYIICLAEQEREISLVTDALIAFVDDVWGCDP